MHLAAAEEVVHPVQRIGAFGDRCLDPVPDAASRLCLGDLQRIAHLRFVGESQRLVRLMVTFVGREFRQYLGARRTPGAAAEQSAPLTGCVEQSTTSSGLLAWCRTRGPRRPQHSTRHATLPAPAVGPALFAALQCPEVGQRTATR